MKNDLNEPLFRIGIRILIRVFFLSLPDPLVKGTDPMIQIRTKMLRIRNSGSESCSIFSKVEESESEFVAMGSTYED
jgi:hypothetical protein